ncbi:MAG: DUF4338 domain-containing protein [Candidatus Synoicihabitans palmerolidicus]|nr:DUF4338 domain-containing protein [Candidatus Synoicihabitans palmerolidicus]
MALLAWGPACYALKDRDRWVGWDATRRVERLSLVVQNRRFLLLTKRGGGAQFRLPGARCGGAHVAGPLAGTLRLSAAARPRPSPTRRPTKARATRPPHGSRSGPARVTNGTEATFTASTANPSTCGCCGPCTPRSRPC